MATRTGHSVKSFMNSYIHYDASGNDTGLSRPMFNGKYEHLDKNGQHIGFSDPAFFGGYVHYDKNHNQTGRSDPDFSRTGNLVGRYRKLDRNAEIAQTAQICGVF